MNSADTLVARFDEYFLCPTPVWPLATSSSLQRVDLNNSSGTRGHCGWTQIDLWITKYVFDIWTIKLIISKCNNVLRTEKRIVQKFSRQKTWNLTVNYPHMWHRVLFKYLLTISASCYFPHTYQGSFELSKLWL